MQREYMTNVMWKKMLEFLRREKSIYVGQEYECRKFINAIFWIARTGAQWRELPQHYGVWNSVYQRFNRWSRKGVWGNLLTFCAQDADMEYAIFDSTIVRAHACSAGYKAQANEGLGRSKGGFTSKIHVLVDGLGNLLKHIIAPGQSSDFTYAVELIKGIEDAYAIGDRGYDSNNIRTAIASQNCIPVIPCRSNRKAQYEYDRHIYKERSLVEFFFSKAKHFRRVFSRYDKTICNFASFVSFVGVILWLR